MESQQGLSKEPSWFSSLFNKTRNESNKINSKRVKANELSNKMQDLANVTKEIAESLKPESRKTPPSLSKIVVTIIDLNKTTGEIDNQIKQVKKLNTIWVRLHTKLKTDLNELKQTLVDAKTAYGNKFNHSGQEVSVHQLTDENKNNLYKAGKLALAKALAANTLFSDIAKEGTLPADIMKRAMFCRNNLIENYNQMKKFDAALLRFVANQEDPSVYLDLLPSDIHFPENKITVGESFAQLQKVRAWLNDKNKLEESLTELGLQDEIPKGKKIEDNKKEAVDLLKKNFTDPVTNKSHAQEKSIDKFKNSINSTLQELIKQRNQVDGSEVDRETLMGNYLDLRETLSPDQQQNLDVAFFEHLIKQSDTEAKQLAEKQNKDNDIKNKKLVASGGERIPTVLSHNIRDDLFSKYLDVKQKNQLIPIIKNTISIQIQHEGLKEKQGILRAQSVASSLLAAFIKVEGKTLSSAILTNDTIKSEIKKSINLLNTVAKSMNLPKINSYTEIIGLLRKLNSGDLSPLQGQLSTSLLIINQELVNLVSNQFLRNENLKGMFQALDEGAKLLGYNKEIPAGYSILFLRYLNPLLVSPQFFSDQPTPDSSHIAFITLVNKFNQNHSNDIKYGEKEPEYLFLNDALEEAKTTAKPLQNTLREVAQPPRKALEKPTVSDNKPQDFNKYIDSLIEEDLLEELNKGQKELEKAGLELFKGPLIDNLIEPTAKQAIPLDE
jgi:hypothetical protein